MRTLSRIPALALTLALAALTAAPALAGAPRHHPRHGPPGQGPGGPGASFRLGLGLFTPDGDSGFWDGTELEFTGTAEDLEDASLTAEFRLPVGRMTSVAFAAGHYSGETFRSYRDFVDADGFEIEHQAMLDVTPLTLGVVLHPLGRRGGVSPYVGAGGGFYFWSYEEVGDFIIFDDLGDPTDIVFDELRSDGVTTGWYAMAGLDIPVSPYFSVFGEARWTEADDEHEDDFSGLGEIDLSGREFRAGLSWSF